MEPIRYLSLNHLADSVCRLSVHALLPIHRHDYERIKGLHGVWLAPGGTSQNAALSGQAGDSSCARRSAQVDGAEISLGDVIEMESDAEELSEESGDKNLSGPLGLLQALWQTPSGSKTMQAGLHSIRSTFTYVSSQMLAVNAL